MKKKVAVLVDGEWFRIALENDLRGKIPNGITAEIVYKNSLITVEKDEEVYRIFYYDCEPYCGKTKNPISRQNVDCTSAAKKTARARFFKELGALPHVALRRGVVKPRAWTIKNSYLKSRIKTGNHQPLTASDVRLTMTQKGVDMRIGIDVATLSLKGQVDRIILISGDADMIPAMKLARREGVQVAVVELDGRGVKPEMIEDSDFVRRITAIP